VRFRFLRGTAAFLSVLAGGALFLFSIAVAFGWDRGPLSLAGTIIAVLGLTLMFWGYRSIRNLDGAPLAAVCLKLALGFGSAFLVVGLVALFLSVGTPTPTGYFLAVGCFCVLAFIKFRAYTRNG
jgi:hypothetical protein